MLIELEIIVDDHDEADEKVGGSDTSKNDQSLLTDGDPWRVADAQEDGLSTVSQNCRGTEDTKTYMIIALLLAVLGKESSRGRHFETLSCESDALGFPVRESEVDELPSDLLSDTSVGNGRETGPIRVLADKVWCMFLIGLLDRRTDRSVGHEPLRVCIRESRTAGRELLNWV